MPSFNSLFGSNLSPTLEFLIIFVLLVVIVMAIVWIVKKIVGGPRIAGGRARQPRLAAIEAAAIDDKRRLVIVRRDNIEHLIMIGGPNDLLIEQSFSRVQPNIAPEPAAIVSQPNADVVDTPPAAVSKPQPAPAAAPTPAPKPQPAAPVAQAKPQSDMQKTGLAAGAVAAAGATGVGIASAAKSGASNVTSGAVSFADRIAERGSAVGSSVSGSTREAGAVVADTATSAAETISGMAETATTKIGETAAETLAPKPESANAPAVEPTPVVEMAKTADASSPQDLVPDDQSIEAALNDSLADEILVSEPDLDIAADDTIAASDDLRIADDDLESALSASLDDELAPSDAPETNGHGDIQAEPERDVRVAEKKEPEDLEDEMQRLLDELSGEKR